MNGEWKKKNFKNMKKNIIKEKSFEFAFEIIKLYILLKDRKEFVISKQLLRSGTSIGANVVEADAAQSRKDFLSKMAIASKEARETEYWLQLLQKSTLVDIPLDDYLDEIDNITNILTRIVKTTSESITS